MTVSLVPKAAARGRAIDWRRERLVLPKVTEKQVLWAGLTLNVKSESINKISVPVGSETCRATAKAGLCQIFTRDESA